MATMRPSMPSLLVPNTPGKGKKAGAKGPAMRTKLKKKKPGYQGKTKMKNKNSS